LESNREQVFFLLITEGFNAATFPANKRHDDFNDIHRNYITNVSDPILESINIKLFARATQADYFRRLSLEHQLYTQMPWCQKP
jgi:hypothetical protein